MAATGLLSVPALFVLLLGASGAAAQQTKPCALVAPKYLAQGATVRFEITIDCQPGLAHAKRFPVGRDVLIGLTVYAGADATADRSGSANAVSRRVVDAAADIDSALAGGSRSKSVLVAGAPKWIMLVDEDAESYDFSAKIVRVDKAGSNITVSFEGSDKAIAGKQHLLFAAWPASARKPCNRGDKYARSGCRRDGYVIGSGAGVEPIAAYPGLEITDFENGDTAERWIVERFR